MRLKTVLIAAACAAALLLYCPPVYSAQPEAAQELWKYVHPGAKFLAGVDWLKVKNSPTGRMFSKQLAEQGGKFKSSGPSLAMFDQIEQLLLSGTEAAAGFADTSELIVAALGRIDRAALKKNLPPGTAVERFKGVDLYVPPKSKEGEMLLAVVSDRLALAGDRAAIARVLEQPGAADPALAQRAADMAARCEIWVVAAALSQSGAAAANPQMKQIEDIESMDLGIQLQRGLGLRMNLIARSEDAAKGLAMLAQLVTSMAAQNQQQSPEVATIFRSLDVKVEGAAVRLSMDVPLAQLERGVLQAKATAKEMGRKTLESMIGIQPSGQMPPGLRPAVQGQSVMLPAPPPQPEPPRKRTIRIVGADEGDREITYTTGGKGN